MMRRKKCDESRCERRLELRIRSQQAKCLSHTHADRVKIAAAGHSFGSVVGRVGAARLPAEGVLLVVVVPHDGGHGVSVVHAWGVAAEDESTRALVVPAVMATVGASKCAAQEQM